MFQIKLSNILVIIGLLASIALLTSCSAAATPPPVTVRTTATVTATPPAAPVSSTLIIQADTVSGAPGAQGVTPNNGGVCVQTNQYKATNSIVWRIKVFDPATGKPMDDKALQSVQVKLPDGQVFKGQYGGHPGGPGTQPTDNFWSTAWTIPATYPTGSLNYQVNAQSTDGRSGAYNQFNVAPSLLTIVK